MEIVFPVVDPVIQERIRHYLDTEIADNVKASVYMPDGSYKKQNLHGKKKVNSQEQFCEEAEEAAKAVMAAQKKAGKKRVFTPAAG